MAAVLKKIWFELFCCLVFWFVTWQASLQADAGNVAMTVFCCFLALVYLNAVAAVILSEQIDKLISEVRK